MRRRPPRSTRTDTLFPYRRSSDLLDVLVALQADADSVLRGAGRGEHLRAVGAEQLRVDVLAGAQSRQALHAEVVDMSGDGIRAEPAFGSLVHLLLLGDRSNSDRDRFVSATLSSVRVVDAGCRLDKLK